MIKILLFLKFSREHSITSVIPLNSAGLKLRAAVALLAFLTVCLWFGCVCPSGVALLLMFLLTVWCVTLNVPMLRISSPFSNVV